MKISFFGVNNWQKEYLQQRIIGHEVLFFEESLGQVKDKTIYDSDIIGIFVFCTADKKTLSKFKNLKMITTMSAGYDHIDLDYCKKKNIVITNASGYGDNTVAEMAFSLMLNLSRHTHKAYERSLKGKLSFIGLEGFDLLGKTLGVIGTGRIGQATIKIARGFGMRVIASDAYPNQDVAEQLGFKYVDKKELFSQSDIISIHVPLLESTEHMINEDAINMMKPGVMIINTSRGPIVDTKALIEGLKSKKIAGAGLDVLEHEKASMAGKKDAITKLNDKLIKMENVIVTPHLAFYTREALTRILDITLTNIFDLIEHRGFRNQIK